MKNIHKYQGISLIIAVIMLWFMPLISTNVTMIVVTTILLINAVLEFIN